MDLVNFMYRYINKMLPAHKLLVELDEMEILSYSEDERKEIEELKKEIQEIVETIPNEIDDVEKRRLENADHFIESFDKILANDETDEETKKIFEKRKQALIEDKAKTRDGGKLFSEMFTLLTRNPLIAKYAKSMDDEELLEFIAQYISVPFPPVLEQSEFEGLVKAGIDGDKREALWRLAFNYNRKGIDFSSIVDYFIEKRDAYYLTELISAVQEDLNMDELLDKVIETKDKKFFQDIVNHNGMSYLNSEQKERARSIKLD